MKKIIITIYLSIGLIYALYGTFFDYIYKYKGFAYNLGRGLFWPAAMFPALGKAIGLIILILIFSLYKPK